MTGMQRMVKNRPTAYYTSEPIQRPSRPIHLNVHIEFDPGMVGKSVLVCCMTCHPNSLLIACVWLIHHLLFLVSLKDRERRRPDQSEDKARFFSPWLMFRSCYKLTNLNSQLANSWSTPRFTLNSVSLQTTGLNMMTMENMPPGTEHKNRYMNVLPSKYRTG